MFVVKRDELPPGPWPNVAEDEAEAKGAGVVENEAMTEGAVTAGAMDVLAGAPVTEV